MTETQKRMAQLMQPIEKQIMMCDNRDETIMFACAMLHSCMTILDANIGKQGRKEVIIEANKRD